MADIDHAATVIEDRKWAQEVLASENPPAPELAAANVVITSTHPMTRDLAESMRDSLDAYLKDENR